MPSAPENPLAELLANHYGLAGELRRLPGELDENFHLVTGSGSEVVVKLMGAERAVSLVQLQVGALAHLAKRAEALSLPRIVPRLDGKAWDWVRDLAGRRRILWLLTFQPGRTLAKARPRTPELLGALGGFLGELNVALADFSAPAARRDFKWDLRRASWVSSHLDAIEDPRRREWVELFLARFRSEVEPRLQELPLSVIHGDANDYNVLVQAAGEHGRRSIGLIDFGDIHEGLRVAEPAVAAAYALFDSPDPLKVIAEILQAYHHELPLSEVEIDVVFPLVAMRLVVSVVNSSLEHSKRPDDAYVTISARPAWAALERLAGIHPRFARYSLRAACGLPALPHGRDVVAWLATAGKRVAPILGEDLKQAPLALLDLSVGSTLLGADPKNTETTALARIIAAELTRQGARIGVGRYAEPRLLYTSPAYSSAAGSERRTVHLGVDLFVPAGTPVFAPLAGTVHLVAHNNAPKDYGPLVILRHETDEGMAFYSLVGHLDPEVLERLSPGQQLEAGELLGKTGAPPENGDWPPHPHVQLILDLLDLDDQFPGVAFPSQAEVWRSLSPDPGPLLGVEPGRFAAPTPDPETLANRRARLLGGSLRLSYKKPLEMVRGFGAWLYDAWGQAYLDVYNNVPHVGHSHPRVVEAVSAQLALLNTNTRYLHSKVLDYAERLTALLPPPLSVCFFVSSGSEANELAVRLARAATGGRDLVVLGAAYHGHTSTLIDLSPYKHDGPGGQGRPSWVHVAPLPDDYRGPFKRHDPGAGAKYGAAAAEVVEAIAARGGRLAGFLAESLPSVGGQLVPPPGYLETVYRVVRAAGGVAVADEVQTGFGRLGRATWGFELQGVVPDIVVMGKPIGNGFPLAAVVTTPEIARAFDSGMEFFATFGGNPVAATAGLTVLEVLVEENLQAHAERVGDKLLAGLEAMVERHPIAGDARGLGFFLGLELVKDRATLEPAAEAASYVVNRLKDRGILAGTDGPFHNVIKIRPPMVFSDADADLFLAALEEVLGEDFVTDQVV